MSEEHSVSGLARLVHEPIVLHAPAVRHDQEPLRWPVCHRETRPGLLQSLRKWLGFRRARAQARDELEERGVAALVLRKREAVAAAQLA